jgi:hypothetical protein
MTKEQQIQIVREVIKTVDLWEENHFKDYRHPNIFKYIVNDYNSKKAEQSLEIQSHKSALEDIYEIISLGKIDDMPSIDRILAVMKWLSDELEEHKYETIQKFWENHTNENKAYIDIVKVKDIKLFKNFFSINDEVKKARLYEDGRYVYDYTNGNEEKTVDNFGDYDMNPFFEENIQPGKHYYFPSSYEKGGYNLNRFKTFWEIFFPNNFQ